MSNFISFYEWINKETNQALLDQKWLIVGKGPSFSGFDSVNQDCFITVALNHTIQKIKSNFVHLIDFDVFDTCQNEIDKNAEYLIIPWVPHINNRPGKRNLGELIEGYPLLEKLAVEKRILFYNHLPKRAYGNSPCIDVKFFSAEAVVKLLASSNIKTIKTIGIDGGTNYSKAFSNLVDKTLLKNGRSSFDIQFEEFAKVIMKNNVDLAPIDIESPIKVFVATTEAQLLSVKVLEYSIRKHSSMSVEVIPLHLNDIKFSLPKDKDNWPRTPFSFQRFLIPQLKNYQGRGIYLDSDMQVFKDIKSIWMLPFNGNQVLTVREPKESGRRPQFSVMLMDCESLDWNIQTIVSDLDNGNLNYQQLVYEMGIAKTDAVIDSSWNSLERYEMGTTALLHYTDMNTQPWVSTENPLGYIWFQDLFEAIDKKLITIEFIQDHIKKEYIRPSLMYQVEQQITDSLLLPKKAKLLDKNFKAPFQSIHQHNASPWLSKKHIVKAYLRQLVKKIR